ncbi:hypothetical protein Hanom_Chr03g00226301 [Helianthus anomalus]
MRPESHDPGLNPSNLRNCSDIDLDEDSGTPINDGSLWQFSRNEEIKMINDRGLLPRYTYIPDPRTVSPTLPGPDDPAFCTPERIVIYTLAFSSCGVRYPLSTFKVELLKHFGIHFSQLHPFAFMRVVHFELSCVAVSGELSVPLFCMFYKLVSDEDWFTFTKRKDNVSPPCYSFMPTSTYPKE